MNDRPLEIPADDFVRRFSKRTCSLMWLLGAGASASAGVPTAMDMIWQFKRSLFVSQSSGAQRLGRPVATGNAQPNRRPHQVNSRDALSSCAERVRCALRTAYPAEADRRTVLDAALTGVKPSYGHMALATLMRHRLLRPIWRAFFVLHQDASRPQPYHPCLEIGRHVFLEVSPIPSMLDEMIMVDIKHLFGSLVAPPT